MKYVCAACGKGAGSEIAKYSLWCPHCGARALEARDEEEDGVKLRRGSTASITPLDDVEMPELAPCRAPLLACVGGYCDGRIVVVAAPPGIGKSTECARVAVDLDAPVAYLDREMSGVECKAVFLDAGASEKFIQRKLHRIIANNWRDVLDAAAATASDIVIVDSVQKWVPQQDEEDFVTAIREHIEDGVTFFLIQQWTREGKRARGTLVMEHAGAITIDLHHDTIDVRKTRPPWQGKQGIYRRPRLKPGQTFPAGRFDYLPADDAVVTVRELGPGLGALPEQHAGKRRLGKHPPARQRARMRR
jgi:predicted ATP-dependent serine protease